ncbi:MAG TPA: hypothetical protein VHB46_06420 [Burkholderiales bacterium]|nr:hypothetical protein [Burkholderiales bacterium]
MPLTLLDARSVPDESGFYGRKIILKVRSSKQRVRFPTATTIFQRRIALAFGGKICSRRLEV